jgi:hypothetical protein
MKKTKVKSQLVFTQLPFVESYRYWLNTFIYAIFLCLSCTGSSTASAVGWWNSDWSKCREITITNTGSSTLNNFPAYISLSYDSDMQADYDDIRFINSTCNNNGSELNFEVESFTGTNADMWVNLDSLPTGGKTIAVYYGNASVASGENVNNTWDNNHQGVWHLREDTGSTNQDSTSNFNNGTPTKNPASTTGKIGNALNFDVGDKSYIDVGNANSLNLSSSNYSNWTISLWVKPTNNFQSIKHPVMYTYGDYGASFGLAKNNGKMESWRNDSDPIYSNNSVSTGSWNHVVITRTPTNTTFYLNGISNSSSSSVSINQSNKGSFIGGYTNYNDGDLKGVIDEVRVSNVNRSADWIKQSYQLVENQNSHISIGVEVEQVAVSSLTGNLNVDNTFEAYISTDDSVQGTLITSGTHWQTTYNLATSLTPGQTYYLHIKAIDEGGPAGFLGDFEITDSDHTFSNGLTTLNTNTTDWVLSTTGWSDYQPVSAYGTNGAAPWGTRASVDNNAQWIWSSNNDADNLNYFSTKILSTYTCSAVSTLNAVGIKINSGGSDSRINTTTEALAIYSAWLAEGSPNSGLIDSGTYNVAASGSSTVDRIDFGGSGHDFSGTLPYPGAGVSGEDFLVHASGTLSLPAGDYTIYVEADDGFSFTMDTLSGETVSFNKFGNSNAGESNELRYEYPTGNSNTGGSFTLNQDSVFNIAAIFFERTGGDYLEISIANDIRTSIAPSTGYEILSDGALSGKVIFGGCREPVIHHYEISHDGQGLTCEAESVTIKACIDASCSDSNLSTESVTLNFIATPASSSSVISPVAFTGSTTVIFNHTVAETLTFSLDDTSISAANSLVCDDSSGTRCDMPFADTGFRFLVNNNSIDIPTQLSGKPSNIGYKASNLSLQAIKTSTSTGACEAALVNSTDIELVAECIDPVACAIDKKVIINSTPIETQGDVTTPSAYTPISLNFGSTADNTARFDLTYPDAGKIQLHARYNIPVDGSLSGVYMKGSSNAFVVRPFGLSIAVEDANNIENPAAITHNGAVFISAGDIFTTTIKAVQWKTGQDSNNDGNPDETVNIASNLVTTNFGNEITAEMVEITHALYIPKPAELGALSNSSFSFDNGIASNSNMTYSEVGIISFSAHLNDNTYLTANDILGKAPYVGRFIPENFVLSINKEGSFISVCEGIDIDMPFAYSGQMSIVTPSKGVLRYLEQPEILITPKSKLGNHTKNYTGNFNKLTLSGINRFMIDDGTGTLVLAPIEDTTQSGVNGDKVRLTSNFNDGILTENLGVLSFQYNDLDDFFYLHEENSEIIPFPADINLAIASIIDSDTVTALDADGIGDTGIANDTVITLNPTGKEIRFGRAYLANSFGPETSDLPQSLVVQYLDTTTHYENTSDDTCTAFNSSNIALTTIDFDKRKTGVNAVSGHFINGETRKIELLAPSDGSRKNVGVAYGAYDWLKYDWSSNGVYDENPSAIATFGLYRGNDRIIYMREVFN